jgi:hypothetical protein
VSYVRSSGAAIVPSLPGLVCLAVASISNSASVNFTSNIDSTYDEYEIHFQNIIPSTLYARILLRTSSNAGSSFDSGASDYIWSLSRTRPGSSAPAGIASTGDSSIPLDSFGVSNVAEDSGICGIATLFAPSGTIGKKTIAFQCYSDTSVAFTNIGSGVRFSTSAINAFQIISSTGIMVSGLIKLYGVKKSV